MKPLRRIPLGFQFTKTLFFQFENPESFPQLSQYSTVLHQAAMTGTRVFDYGNGVVVIKVTGDPIPTNSKNAQTGTYYKSYFSGVRIICLRIAKQDGVQLFRIHRVLDETVHKQEYKALIEYLSSPAPVFALGYIFGCPLNPAHDKNPNHPDFSSTFFHSLNIP